MKIVRRIIAYARLQFKCALKSLPFAVIATTVLFISFAIVFSNVVDNEKNSEKKQKVKIGVVGDMSDSFLSIGINALQNFDATRFVIEMIPLELNEAKRQMQNGKINIYLIIPEEFIQSVSNGENKKITVVTSNGAANFGTLIMKELAKEISDIVLASQNGIYGMQEYLYDHNGLDVLEQATEEMNIRYINALLNRHELYEIKQLRLPNEVSYLGYFFCAFFVLFLLMWGILCAPVFGNKNYKLPKLMKARGQNEMIQVLGSYLAYICFLLIFILLVLIMVVLFCFLNNYMFEELYGTQELIRFFTTLLPVVLLLGAFQVLLYELSGNLLSGVIIQFIVVMMLGYLSGCFYPISFLPENIINVTKQLPIGLSIQYMNHSLGSEPLFYDTIRTYISIFMLLIITIWVRREKIKR